MKKATLFQKAAGLVLLGSCAFADDTATGLDLSNVAYNTGDVMKVGALVLAAVAVIWGIKKAISMANRG